MSIAIVTDSTSDIPPERAKLLGITVVPLFVIFGEKSYRDQIDLSRPEFFEKLAAEKALPITSQPTAQMFEEAFAPLIEAGHEILCITISSKLSGTINAARAAAQHFPQSTIEIYDSQTATGGLGMMVLRAHEVASSGASMSEVLRALDRERETQGLQLCIADLSHIQRTGRIGKAQAVLGSLIKIVPILGLKDGQVVPLAQVRTSSRAQETMIDLAIKSITDLSKARFLVMHTNAPQLAQNVAEKLQARFGGVQPRMFETLEAGPAIAVHAGPGGVGIFTAQDE
jgi:DegV family protein with EDD domain